MLNIVVVMRKQYDPIRGFRYSNAQWSKLKKAARAAKQTPSDFIRHAAEARMAKLATVTNSTARAAA